MDKWKHRSAGMKCISCMWFVAKEPDIAEGETVPPPVNIGRCRRHAPTMSGYPVVYREDWCGDHKINENW